MMSTRRRWARWLATALVPGFVACAPDMMDVWDSERPDAGMPADASVGCANLECRIPRCAPGKTTSLSGVVNIPAGNLPLPNVTVYVPNRELDPVTSGASCTRCDSVLSGSPIVHTSTDVNGRFKLEGVPAGADVPVVVQAGKWRRKVTVTQVVACEDNALDPDTTRLPRTQAEGDIPKMALTTGTADALQCLLRKLGIADSEFTPEYGSGRVNLYYADAGTDSYVPGMNGGANFTPATLLWESLDNLRRYDVLVLSCEGLETPTNKSVAARAAMRDYLNLGGRVFASHWHNYWVELGATPLPTVAKFNHRMDPAEPTLARVDTSFARGGMLADWLLQNGGSTQRGALSLEDAKSTIASVDPTLAQRWIYLDSDQSVQFMSFNAPVGADDKSQCGRMVLTDIHVTSYDRSSHGDPFPSGCVSTTLLPQEQALIFMFFDLSNCLQPVIG